MSRFDHIVLNERNKQRYGELKYEAHRMAQEIEYLPASREVSLALSKLEECVMWAGKAIRNLQIDEENTIGDNGFRVGNKNAQSREVGS